MKGEDSEGLAEDDKVVLRIVKIWLILDALFFLYLFLFLHP